MSADTVTVVEQPTYVTVTDGDGSAETVVVSDESVTVVEVGIQGPQGPQGTPGASGSNFTQSFNDTTTVTVTHNLSKYPSVTVIDSAGDEVEGDVDYIDLNTLVLTWSAPFSGVVSCN